MWRDCETFCALLWCEPCRWLLSHQSVMSMGYSLMVLNEVLPHSLLCAHAPFQKVYAAQLLEGSFQLHG